MSERQERGFELRFVLRLEAVELTDNEARAYWQGEGDKSRIRKSTPQRDIATE